MKKTTILLISGVTFLALGYWWFVGENNKKVIGSAETEAGVIERSDAYTERYSARVDRVDVVFEHKNYTHYRLTTNGLVREGELNTERGYKTDENATIYVLNWQKPESEQIRYVKLTKEPEHLYFLDANGDLMPGTPLIFEDTEK